MREFFDFSEGITEVGLGKDYLFFVAELLPDIISQSTDRFDLGFAFAAELVAVNVDLGMVNFVWHLLFQCVFSSLLLVF